eukprot:scaffold53920_cov31-Tisochrysis_lutea.AAC.4
MVSPALIVCRAPVLTASGLHALPPLADWLIASPSSTCSELGRWARLRDGRSRWTVAGRLASCLATGGVLGGGVGTVSGWTAPACGGMGTRVGDARAATSRVTCRTRGDWPGLRSGGCTP